ncbi:hypothetical protein JKG68_24625 [Microvirga aerilata]|uniref:Uncharacterized protein n=1 Tax=Microvirga aerilata TaxID=670292 RepID=A0A936ZLZ5_9HYPH|nr:hypothetical protein [Microvirga aerilata]MBL0407124.1 hypothetical protein [Microvirga aerilata]
MRPAPDVAADYQLLLDIRSFQLVLSPEPRADVAFAAKLLDGNGRIVCRAHPARERHGAGDGCAGGSGGSQ